MSLATTARPGANTGSMPADPPDPEVPERATRRTYSARYKLEILAEYEAWIHWFFWRAPEVGAGWLVVVRRGAGVAGWRRVRVGE